MAFRTLQRHDARVISFKGPQKPYLSETICPQWSDQFSYPGRNSPWTATPKWGQGGGVGRRGRRSVAWCLFVDSDLLVAIQTLRKAQSSWGGRDPAGRAQGEQGIECICKPCGHRTSWRAGPEKEPITSSSQHEVTHVLSQQPCEAGHPFYR